MVDSIKITALQDIGGNIAYTTLVPVVNMAGTPTTQKSNLQNVGNLILNGAGGSYFAPAARAILAQSVTNAAQPNITSVGTLSSLAVLGNITAANINGGNLVVANFFSGDGGFLTNVAANGSYSNSNVAAYLPTFTGTVGANRISSNTASGSNVEINANGAVFTFGQGGALYWPAPGANSWVIEPNIDSEFEIKSTSNVVITTDTSNANSHFTFDSDGIFTAPSNVNLLGSRLNVGPDAANIANLASPTLIISNSAAEFIQASIINNNPNGSADWTAQGADSDDEEGYSDLGFTGHSFNDPNFTITEPGVGYVFSQGYANGIGGSLVFATGENGNVNDIIFATGGFMANNEFARIDHANDVFHLTRANSGIQFYDGTIQTTAGGGGVSSELVNGSNSLVLDGDGNIVLEGTPSGNAINRGLVWDYGANANGVNSTLRQDNGGLTVRAWTENGGGANGYSAPVSIVTNQDAATKAWIFDGQGNLNVPSGSINSINDGGDLGAYITLTPDIGLARLTGREAQSSVNYTNTAWANATYTSTQIDFTNAPDLVSFFNDNQFNVGVNQTFSINGDEPVPFTGYTIGTGNDVIVYTSVTADPDPTTVTSIDFLYQLESSVGIDYDDGTLNVNATGLTINIDNDQTSGPDINLRSGDDITLQAKDKALGSESEGGDINILAGDGADDDGAGNTASTGGDIIIDAGRGGDGNSSSGSSGGFTTIRGGAGGSAGLTNAAGPGGYVNIEGGDGGTDGGNTSLGGVGGNVSITAGLTRQEGVNGSNVVISSGQAGPNALAGYVDIFTPASANGFGGTWRFDGNGKLTFPGTPRIDTATNNFEVQAAESINFEANAVVNIYTDTGNAAYQWQFGDDGNLILAGGNSVIQSIANSSLDPTLPNVSTMVFTPDANYNSQVLVLDPTAPGHIHLRAYAFSNIDDPAANIFLGGEDTSFEITSGANNQAVIHSNGKSWTFGNDGNISSDTLTLTTAFANVKTVEYQTAGVWDLYVEDSVTGSNTASSRLNVSFKDNLIDKPQVYIENTKENDGIALRWTFDENGNLNFPRDVAGNSDPYLSIFGGATPTIQSTDASLAGPANLAIQSNYLNLSGFSGDKIVFYADTGEMATDANMTLTTNLANTGNTSSWVFGTDGNLTIPGTSGGFIKTVSNASIGIAAMDNGTNNPAQLLSLNAGTGAATSIVSAYSTNVAIQTNAAGAINTWEFDNTGNLTLPTGGQIVVSGGLVSSGASPAPSINGFSITNSVGISGNGNIAGNNISATGNVSGNFFLGNGSQLTGITATSLVNGTSNVVTTSNGNVTIGIAGNAAIATFTGTGANVTGTLNVTGNVTAQGVGTNLVRRANTISGSNTVVTLDNLNAYIGGAPTRLYIGAATSNMTMAGTSQTMSSGSIAVSSWINVPIVTGAGNGFAMSGAVSSNGDTVVLNITDQGAGSGTWRVTGMIANTSANLYSVSIERLA